MEFIFSMHPSSTAVTREEEATPQKKGANITPEALAMAAKLLSSTPPGITDQVWIDAIAPQLFHLLDGNDGPELARVAAHVVAFGILGRKRLGAPGKLPKQSHRRVVQVIFLLTFEQAHRAGTRL